MDQQPIGRRAALRTMAGTTLALALVRASVGNAPAQELRSATIRGSNVRLRQQPDPEFPGVAVMQGGEVVTLTGSVTIVTNHLWREIARDSGEQGWVRWEFLVGGSPLPADGDVMLESVPVPAEPSTVSVEPPVPTAEPPVEADTNKKKKKKNNDAGATEEAAPEAAPQVDAAPTEPDASSSFASGALGLTLAEAETQYGPSVEDALGRAWALETGQLVLGFEDGEWSSYVERMFTDGADLAAAQTEVVRLAPEDAELIENLDIKGKSVDRYLSASLAARFADLDVWGNGDPGSFVASYGEYDPAGGVELVDRVILTLGSRP